MSCQRWTKRIFPSYKNIKNSKKKKIPIPFSSQRSWYFSFESPSRHYFEFSELKSLAAIIWYDLIFTFEFCYLLTCIYSTQDTIVWCSTVCMLHIKLHALLDILHDDISSGKVIFSLESVKIFVWQFQSIFQTLIELLNFYFDTEFWLSWRIPNYL